MKAPCIQGSQKMNVYPFLSKFLGLKFNEDFFVGYSPERINPGDKERTVTKILKGDFWINT